MKAAIHLGENCKDNLFTHRNTDFETLKTLFDITQKLILNQKHEVRHVSTIDGQVTPWMRSTLLHDKVIQLSKAKVHGYSDSVPCLGKMHRHPDALVNWKEQLKSLQSSNEHRELFGIDGEPFEFEWNIFPGNTAVQIHQEIQVRMTVGETRVEEFEDRIIVDWIKIMTRNVFRILKGWEITQRDYRWDICLFSVLVKKKGYGMHHYKPEAKWNSAADVMRASHQSLQCVGSRILKKNRGKCTIHFSGDMSNAELSFRTIHPANQLSIDGAVVDWCEELAQQIPGQFFSSPEKSIAKVAQQLYRKLEPEEVNTLVQALEARDRLRDHHEKFENSSKQIKESQTCESAGIIKKVAVGKYFRKNEWRVWWGKPDHVDYSSCLVRTRIRNQLDGFVDTRRSVQSVKSRVTCCLDECGIEIQVPSMWKHWSFSWIVDMQRPKPLRGWILSRSRRPSSSLWDGEFYKRWSITRNNNKHWGNSCVEATGTIEHKDELSVWRIHHHWHTHGGGMTFLPLIMSKESLLLGTSRRGWQYSYDIENLTEQFIGVHCYLCYDVISNAKVLELSQILDGQIIYTEETTNPDVSIV